MPTELIEVFAFFSEHIMYSQLSCAICKYSDTNLKVFCSHLRRHEQDASFHVNCNVCHQKFTTVRYWKEHVLAKKCSSVKADTASTGAKHDTESASHPNTPQSHFVEADSQVTDRSNIRTRLLAFVIKLRAQNVSEGICRDVLEFMHCFSKEAVQECLGLSCVGSSSDWEDRAQSLETLCGLSALLKVDSLERKARKEFGAADPVSILLATNEDGKKDSLQYLPLTPQLKRLCDAVNASEDVTLSPDGVLCGLQDGYAHSNDSASLLLSVYYDGFQVGNPLGSKAKNQKVGVIYFAVNSMNNNLSSQVLLSVIFLESLLKTYSWETLLNPLVTELKQLESDGFVTSNGTRFTAHVAVLVGDNLGVHSVAGFSQCFSGGGMVCRHCHGSMQEIREKSELKEFTLRTKEDYDLKIKLLMEEEFDKALLRAYGINSTCPFTSLKGFHPMTSLPPDVMHDLLEGVVPSTIGLVCGELISQGELCLEGANKSISSFPYSRLDTNHPAPLRRDGKSVTVKQQASEAWCLLRLFPLMLINAGVLSSSVFESRLYSLVTQLIKIMLLLTAFTVSLQETEVLQSMVEKFLSDLLCCFPEFKLTPKHHYLLHYADQMRRHGPLRNLWSMRFEREHQRLKRSVANSRNRKNVCMSIATRYQVRTVADQLEDAHVKCGIAFREAIPEVASSMIVGLQLFKRMLVNKETYGAGEIILLRTGVAKIVCLCQCPTDVSAIHFLVQYQVAIYDMALGAFCVSDTDHYQLVGLADLADSQPLGVYSINSRRYAVPHKLVPGYGML